MKTCEVCKAKVERRFNVWDSLECRNVSMCYYCMNVKVGGCVYET